MLNNAGHIDAKIESILAKFAKRKFSEIGCFLLIVSWRSFPLKFPMKSADFFKNLPLKILRNEFFLLKSREIGRFFREFAPENPAKFSLFFRELSEALFL